ncbi:neprilysin-1-like isoform X2 [Amblyomma americanum]
MSMLLFATTLLVGVSQAALLGNSSGSTLMSGATVCNTKVCRERAKVIKKMLSMTVSPCEDFYDFVCKEWKKLNPIPCDRPTHGTFKEVAEIVTNDLREILSNLSHHEGKKQSITEKLGIAYKSCVANENPGRRSFDQLKKILSKDGFNDWPWVRKNQHLFDNFKDVLLKTGMTPLFSVSVTRDMKDLSSNIINLDQISFPLLGRNELIKPRNSAYRRSVEAYKILMQTAFSIMRPEMKQRKARELAEEVFAFESEVAKRTASKEERRNALRHYKRTTIRTLEGKFIGFPLLDLLNKEFRRVNITLKMSEPVTIFAEPYYVSTTKFLRTVSPRTLFNFMGWSEFVSRAGYASKRFRAAKLNYTKDAYGLMKDPPLWKKCVKLLTSSMREVVGHLYVRKKFSSRAKRNVEKMSYSMKHMFQKRLHSIKWMDEATKERAQNKLRKMRPKIGYPKWMMDINNLEGLYRHLGEVKSRDPFVKVIDDIVENNNRNRLLELRKPFDKTKRWGLGPAAVNAFYGPDINEMIFPAAILQEKFFQHGVPDSLNLGAIGSVIGHEMTHGFDDRGSQYDADGRLRQWWSKRTREHFIKKANCFVEQYGSIFDPEANMTLNGKNTLGENIADNGGLRLAFKTYEHLLETSTTKDLRLPGLEEYSGKHLFFIAYGMSKCAFEELRSLLKSVQVQKDVGDASWKQEVCLMVEKCLCIISGNSS